MRLQAGRVAASYARHRGVAKTRTEQHGAGCAQTAVGLKDEYARIFFVNNDKRHALVVAMADHPACGIARIGRSRFIGKAGWRWSRRCSGSHAVKGHEKSHGGIKQCAFQEPVLRRA